ncbi:MAG: hypothetical protein ACN2B6_05480 [Rickettsiales bacterium]
MPRAWIYYIAVVLPLVFYVMLEFMPFTDWLWYGGYEREYWFFLGLKDNDTFQEFIGGWPFWVFIFTILVYWNADQDNESVCNQFYLLPVVFVPFSIIGSALMNLEFNPATLYTHPFIIILAGYCYVLPWLMFVWVMSKLRLLV